MTTLIERARAYLSKMPPAISGSAGHDATFKVAVVLTKGFGFTVEEAFPVMAGWNATCQPPWNESELRHKLRDAAQSSQRPEGYLLLEDLPRPAASPSRLRAPNPGESAKKDRQREAWPKLFRPGPATIQGIADLRKLPVAAVDLCAKHDLLKATKACEGHPCFVISEGTFAQARRFDGGMLETKEGPSKTKNLQGSQGAFIGAKLLGTRQPILLVEGCIGLLEAVAALLLADRTDWTCLAATSASARFAREPDTLARLRGRRVRIVPDNDPAGYDTAAIWCAELRAAGAIVDAYALPEGIKDLGPIVADPDRHAPTLMEIVTL